MIMNKRFLLIEDNGFVAERLSARLKEQYGETQSVVEVAYSVASAKDRWDEEDDVFDCVILDLHVNPSGLKAEESADINPFYSLKAMDYFYDRGQEKGITQDEINSKTIVFSKYTTQFKDKYPNTYKFKAVISKEGDNYEKVIEAVNDVISRQKS
jgi:hypothetical protein